LQIPIRQLILPARWPNLPIRGSALFCACPKEGSVCAFTASGGANGKGFCLRGCPKEQIRCCLFLFLIPASLLEAGPPLQGPLYNYGSWHCDCWLSNHSDVSYPRGSLLLSPSAWDLFCNSCWLSIHSDVSYPRGSLLLSASASDLFCNSAFVPLCWVSISHPERLLLSHAPGDWICNLNIVPLWWMFLLMFLSFRSTLSIRKLFFLLIPLSISCALWVAAQTCSKCAYVNRCVHASSMCLCIYACVWPAWVVGWL